MNIYEIDDTKYITVSQLTILLGFKDSKSGWRIIKRNLSRLGEIKQEKVKLHEGIRTANRTVRLFTYEQVLIIAKCSNISSPDIFNNISEFFSEKLPEIYIPTLEMQTLKILQKTLNGICDIIYQYRIGPYRADYYIPKFRIILEQDGPEHKDKYKTITDKKRESYIAKQGYKILRASNSTDPLEIVNLILKTIFI